VLNRERAREESSCRNRESSRWKREGKQLSRRRTAASPPVSLIPHVRVWCVRLTSLYGTGLLEHTVVDVEDELDGVVVAPKNELERVQLVLDKAKGDQVGGEATPSIGPLPSPTPIRHRRSRAG
jgi:hypothetical protein